MIKMSVFRDDAEAFILFFPRTPFATFTPARERARFFRVAARSFGPPFAGIAGRILRRCDNERSDRYLRASRMGVPPSRWTRARVHAHRDTREPPAKLPPTGA